MTRRRLPYAPGAQIDLAVLFDGEIAFDTTGKRLRVGDGSTPGGQPVPSFSDLKVRDGSDFNRNFGLICAPYVHNDHWNDNVLAIQNLSVGDFSGGAGTRLVSGNAALNFLDREGTEKGAMGYSRNSALPPLDGYTPDTVYVECGNPFATLNPSDFAVIVTMKEGSAFWNGEHTAYKAIEVSSQTGGITLTTNGGMGAINLRDDVYFGRDNSPSTAHFNLSNSRFRVRERASLGQVSLTTNIVNMGAPLDVDVVKDDDDSPSWEVSFGASDYFGIRRTDGGANKKAVELFRIQSNGAICSTVTGNPEGAIGAPVGALYPSGNGKLYFKASGSGVTGWREVVLA